MYTKDKITVYFALKLGDEITKTTFDNFHEMYEAFTSSTRLKRVWICLDTHEKNDTQESIVISEKLENCLNFITSFNARKRSRVFHLFGYPNYQEACGYIVDLKNGISELGFINDEKDTSIN